MIVFPQIERLVVHNYGLYPGILSGEGLDLNLSSGPWIILGVNGLGKSTLLLMMRYLLTGPVRARPAGFAGEQSRDLQAVDPRFFAVRVSDEARNATARIDVRFGTTLVRIERRLSNMSLVSATVLEGGSEAPLLDEEAYRRRVAELMRFAQFEDAVRLLDRVVFFLEGRQPLVWDLASQFEVFRALLTPQSSAELRRLEGEIISSDSAARNLSATLFKILQRREKEREKAKSADDTRARLAAAQADRDRFAAQEAAIQADHQKAEEDRADHRLRVKRAEHEADAAAQSYEKIKFEVLRQAFAGVKPNEQYVFLRLISERLCLACNQLAEPAAKELEHRRDAGLCLVCGSPRPSDDKVTHISEALGEKSEEAYRQLDSAREAVKAAEVFYKESDERVKAHLNELYRIRVGVEDADQRIRRLRKLLPSDESAELSREEDRIATLRREVQVFRDERDAAERQIDDLLEELKRAAEQIRDSLESRFLERAAPFFAERVRLVYAPRETRIGQGGRVFSFPAFEIEMTSGATQGEFVRRRADQVSLSQREYLDIIFRMAIVDVLSVSGGSLIVDGPEGSVDAVFAERAGDLFAQFASTNLNAILACNIVEGGFIPHALRAFQSAKDRRARVVNLIAAATPTAALRELRPEYERKVEDILAEGPRR